MPSDQVEQHLPRGGVRDRGAVQIGAVQDETFDLARMIGRVPRGDRPARRAGEHDDRFGAYDTNDARKDLDLVVESHPGAGRLDLRARCLDGRSERRSGSAPAPR